MNHTLRLSRVVKLFACPGDNPVKCIDTGVSGIYAVGKIVIK